MTETRSRSGILIIVGLLITLIGIWVGLNIVGGTQKQYDECLKVQTVDYCEAHYTLK